jgi:hypothetical protein
VVVSGPLAIVFKKCSGLTYFSKYVFTGSLSTTILTFGSGEPIIIKSEKDISSKCVRKRSREGKEKVSTKGQFRYELLNSLHIRPWNCNNSSPEIEIHKHLFSSLT